MNHQQQKTLIENVEKMILQELHSEQNFKLTDKGNLLTYQGLILNVKKGFAIQFNEDHKPIKYFIGNQPPGTSTVILKPLNEMHFWMRFKTRFPNYTENLKNLHFLYIDTMSIISEEKWKEIRTEPIDK